MKEYGNLEPNTLVYISASESYPKKNRITDDPSLNVPFTELIGENVEYLGKSVDAVLAISNFRFFALLQHAFINIPLMLIGGLDCKGKEFPELQLWCKDGRSFQLKFDSSECCAKWFDRLKMKCSACQGRLENIFSFAFHAWSLDSPEKHPFLTDVNNKGEMQCDFMDEYRRMGFHKDKAWKITEINSKFELCSSYPKLHIVPSHITDEKLKKVAKFRSSRRFPSAVWRNQQNGAVIVRCSQPEVGLLYRRCQEDEYFLQSLGGLTDSSVNKTLVNGIKTITNGVESHNHSDGNSSDSGNSTENSGRSTAQVSNGISTEKKVLVIDCRSYYVTIGNKLKGGGTECTEYYPNCDVQFMNLANIHVIRASFQSLRELCCSDLGPTWLSSLETTQWLFHISLLLKTSLALVKAVEQDQQHVVVHCSDGWDRTTQVVALSELLLDPYYRTIKGFRVLLEREWLAFGHKFADRNGHGCQSDEPNERCPVFIQWLDCVYQLLRQFPCSFQFNETFLVKLAHHSYSCLFGTFLCNTEQERLEANIKQRTHSVWSFLNSESRTFRNFLYSPLDSNVLYPEYQIRSLLLWKSLYLASPVFIFNDSPERSTPTSSNTARRNSDGDLILASEERPNPEFRDDTNPELCSTKALIPKVYKYPSTKGLLLNVETPLDNPSDGSNHDGVSGVNQEGVNTCSMTSSSQTLIEENHSVLNGHQNGDSGEEHDVISQEACSMNNHAELSSNTTVTNLVTANGCQSNLPSEDIEIYNDIETGELYCLINKHIDVDGLTLISDPVQTRLLELEKSYRRQIDELQAQLQAQSCCSHELGSEVENGQKMSLPFPKFDGPNSLSSNGTTDTCGSWEHVEDEDVTPTLWVPDHLAYSCCSCDSLFSVTNRKHHCRNCGNVFCHHCCSDMTPVPSEQHYDPVRVCKSCYQKLQIPHDIQVAAS